MQLTWSANGVGLVGAGASADGIVAGVSGPDGVAALEAEALGVGEAASSFLPPPSDSAATTPITSSTDTAAAITTVRCCRRCACSASRSACRCRSARW